MLKDGLGKGALTRSARNSGREECCEKPVAGVGNPAEQSQAEKRIDNKKKREYEENVIA